MQHCKSTILQWQQKKKMPTVCGVRTHWRAEVKALDTWQGCQPCSTMSHNWPSHIWGDRALRCATHLPLGDPLTNLDYSKRYCNEWWENMSSSNHEETAEKSQMRDILCSLKMSQCHKRQDRLKSCFRLWKIKETRHPKATSTTGLDPGRRGKRNGFTGYYCHNG